MEWRKGETNERKEREKKKKVDQLSPEDLTSLDQSVI